MSKYEPDGRIEGILPKACQLLPPCLRGCSYIYGYPRFSLQITQVLRVYNVFSIHGWSEVKPAENDDVIYEKQPKTSFIRLTVSIRPSTYD